MSCTSRRAVLSHSPNKIFQIRNHSCRWRGASEMSIIMALLSVRNWYRCSVGLQPVVHQLPEPPQWLKAASWPRTMPARASLQVQFLAVFELTNRVRPRPPRAPSSPQPSKIAPSSPSSTPCPQTAEWWTCEAIWPVHSATVLTPKIRGHHSE